MTMNHGNAGAVPTRIRDVKYVALCGAALIVGIAGSPSLASAKIAGLSSEPIGTGGDDNSAEIVVTAQRRAQSLQDIPASITALSGRDLEARGIEGAEGLKFAVPSLTVGTLLGETRIAIRGVGINTSGSSPSVAISADGVYQPRSAMGNIQQIDLDRVEVLRGPQGTLYGRNANGGAINFISRAPQEEFSGYVLGGYAEYDELHLQGMANVPIAPGLRMRLVLDYRDRQDGFVKNLIFPDRDLDKGKTLSGRLRVAADLTDMLSLDLSLTAGNRKGPFEYNQYLAVPAGIAARYPGATATARHWRTTADAPSEIDRRYKAASGTLRWSVPFGEIKAITAFQNYKTSWDSDSDATDGKFWTRTSTGDADTFTQEVTVNASIERLDLVVGGFYMKDEARQTNLIYFESGLGTFGPGTAIDLLANLNVKAHAAFADATFNIVDSLRLIGGLRYSHDRIGLSQTTQFATILNGTRTPGPTTCNFSGEQTFDSWTYRGGAQLDLGLNHMLYGTVSTGFKSGGFNTSSCNDPFEPENITAYEVGVKSTLFDDTMTINLSAFHYEYKNFQISQFVSPIVGLLVSNAAGAKIDGAEVELNWMPDPHWRFNGYLTLLDARYTEFSNVDNLNDAAGVQNLAGNPLNNAPRAAGGVSVSWSSNQTAIGTFTARANVAATSRVYLREFKAEADSQEPYALVNASLNLDLPGGRYSTRLFVTNLTNKAYISSLTTEPTLDARLAPLGPPRQFGVEFRAQF